MMTPLAAVETTMREDEVTLRTQLAEMRADVRSVRERVESRTSESLRRFDAHTEEDARRFDSIDASIAEFRGEFKQIRDSLAGLVTSGAVANVKILFLVTIAGALGSAAVAIASHLIEGVAR